MADTNDTLSGDESLHLPEFDSPPADPMPLLKGWLVRAQADGVREPLAASLATAGPQDADGPAIPSTRVVLVKAFDERGLIFGTYTSSRKGRDLAANPYAALGFYWRETMQQLRVEGTVELLAADESAALFADRPRAAQATTAASRQGQPLPDEGALVAEATALAEGSRAS
ncbi:pyridoxamine 5'-phosphate oxidase family protein [Leifsonia poae]|uniref:pyridoxamine 5'-phosphate oxidase family protein n=1 Tax=Leifsonia poae TaxID=110933 RepID=UPI003D678629